VPLVQILPKPNDQDYFQSGVQASCCGTECLHCHEPTTPLCLPGEACDLRILQPTRHRGEATPGAAHTQGNCIWTPFEAHVGDEASGWLVSKDTLITKDPFFGPEWGQIGQMQLPCRLRQVVPYEPGRVRLSPIALATPFRRTRWVYCSKIRPSASSHHPWFMVEWTHHKNEGQSPRCERLVIQRWEKRPWESTVILHGKEKRVTGQSAIVVPHCAIVESQDAFIRRVGDPGWQRVRVPL
jgi:hypothetical protein